MLINIGRLQIKFFVTILEKRIGACSNIYNSKDEHILMWDFDKAKLRNIIKSLQSVQNIYKLPNIYVVLSSPKSYHAYSFTARKFREIISILSATPEIDMKYLSLGIIRGYYTLRITPRKNDSFKLIKILESSVDDEVNPLDITVNEYLTSNKGGH